MTHKKIIYSLLAFLCMSINVYGADQESEKELERKCAVDRKKHDLQAQSEEEPFVSQSDEEYENTLDYEIGKKKYDLRIQGKKEPLISEMEFDKDSQMTVTIGFKKVKLTPQLIYKHACVAFEYFDTNLNKYLYDTIHLRGEINSFGFGSQPIIRNHHPKQILFKFVKDYEIQGKQVQEVEPDYQRAFSFICDKSKFQEVKEESKRDRRAIKFSLVADLWKKNHYNSSSYANRILKLCEHDIGFTKKLSKTDKNFEEALLTYATANSDRSKVWNRN